MQCRLTLLAVLAVSVASAAEDGPPDRRGDATQRLLVNPFNIVLVWYDVNGLRPRDVSGVAREVESVFREIGVEITWRIGRIGEPARDPARLEIPVILLAAPAGGTSPGVMGAVLRSHTPPSPVWVFLDNVRSALGYVPERSRPPTEKAEREVDVALGRTIAHEVVHAAAPWRPHARASWAAPSIAPASRASEDRWARIALPRSAAASQPWRGRRSRLPR